MSDMQKMLDEIPLPDDEPILGKTYRADGWVYRDLPNLSLENFDKFVSIVGVNNIEWLTLAQRSWPDGAITKRGQCLISPAGIEACKAHVAARDGGQ